MTEKSRRQRPPFPLISLEHSHHNTKSHINHSQQNTHEICKSLHCSPNLPRTLLVNSVGKLPVCTQTGSPWSSRLPTPLLCALCGHSTGTVRVLPSRLHESSPFVVIYISTAMKLFKTTETFPLACFPKTNL